MTAVTRGTVFTFTWVASKTNLFYMDIYKCNQICSPDAGEHGPRAPSLYHPVTVWGTNFHIFNLIMDASLSEFGKQRPWPG